MNDLYIQVKKYIQSSLIEKALRFLVCLFILSLLLFMCFLFFPIIKEIQVHINTVVEESNNAVKGIYH